MIVASLALAIALGGTSYAAVELPAGSVGARQLRSDAVTSAKLGRGAVTSAKLSHGAVTSAKLGRGAVTSAKLRRGAVTTLKLAPGAVTSTRVRTGAGVSLVYKSGMVRVQPGKQAAAFTECPAGMSAVGGGETPDDARRVLLIYDAPYNSKRKASLGPADSWVADVSNDDSARAHDFAVYAVCITAGAAR